MKTIISPFILFIILVGVVSWITNIAMESQCRNNVTEMGRNYRYDFINGCRIQQKDGTYIYWEMFKSVNN